MKRKLTDITGYFKIERLKNDKQIIVFMVCLLIATVLWFLNALSKDYSTVVSYPVKFVNPPKNQFVSNQLPQKLEFKVEAHGFTLLRHKLSLSFSPIVLNLTTLTKQNKLVNGEYSILTSALINRISDQISKEISIEEINPEVFTIVLDSLKTKTVTVEPNVKLLFKPQFNLKEPIGIVPKQVTVTGPASIIDSIQILKTEEKTFDKLEMDEEKVVSVIHPEKTEVKPEKVVLKIPVEKFTEKEVKVPLEIKNKPEGTKIKLFPSEIKVSFLVGLSEFENINSSNFRVTVDYEKITPANSSLQVALDTKPAYIQLLRIYPESVEYLIEND